MERMYGVVNGVYLCNNGRVDEINKRISNRNIPSDNLQPQYDMRPVSTKYGFMQILDERKSPTVNLKSYKSYSPEKVFNPGNTMAPWSGFSNNINDESKLRNQFFALQRCDQSTYVPSANSDLYKTTVSYKPVEQTHKLLFDKPEFAPFNPDSLKTDVNIFNNSTVQSIKNHCN